MFLASVAGRTFAAGLIVQALGLAMQPAAAGTASAALEVRAQPSVASGCRAGSEHLILSCGSPSAPNVLQPRPESSGLTLADGWITYGNRVEAYDSVYAASLTTRVIRYEQWEYIETLVSW